MIILDEVQYVHASTLLVLQQFLDETGYIVKRDGTKVPTTRALFGLISDFGQEGRTQGMTLEELEQLVTLHSLELWDMDPKQTHLIQYTFPFVSLTDQDLEGIIRYHLVQEIPKINFGAFKITQVKVSESALQWMRTQTRKHYQMENGRGAQKYLSKYVLPKLKKSIPKLSHPNNELSIHYQQGQLTFDLKQPSPLQKDL